MLSEKTAKRINELTANWDTKRAELADEYVPKVFRDRNLETEYFKNLCDIHRKYIVKIHLLLGEEMPR